MKKVLWLLTILFVGFVFIPTNAALNLTDSNGPADKKPAAKEGPDGIQFTEASWKEILKKAKAEKKIIFLDAYASWCQPCKMLQKQVFTKKAVGDFYNDKFINVKMDMEKGEGPALAQVYPLEAYPTLLFIDGNGRVLKKVLGYQSPENLISIGKSIRFTREI
ncbi:thioredoxin family protein [Spirosoma soli]|uniref:Thioredoxin family protein n=1 Tax=Spirosoma soli TaxID=1770529 RepID=A0ABW5MAJ1_9BACT